MDSRLLMFPGVGTSVMLQSSAVESPVSGFSSQPLTVESRLLRQHSTEDQMPRLMVKQLSRARNTQGDSQSYIVKRKEGDRGDQEEKRENQKGIEQSSQ